MYTLPFTKVHLLKYPETVPKKRNLEKKISDSKQHIWSLSIIFRFSGRKSQIQQQLAKRITHFKIQFSSQSFLHLRTSTRSTFWKMYSPKHIPKLCSLLKFSSKDVSGWCQIIHLHCTIFKRPRTAFSKHLESKCLYIPVNLRKKTFYLET